jgi:hypothetical protein
MQYHWLDCSGCGCHVAVNWTVYPERVSGSLRRWSADRSTNDGRRFEFPVSQTASDGGFTTPCVCGQEIAVPGKPDAVGASRDPGLRVTLGSE